MFTHSLEVIEKVVDDGDDLSMGFVEVAHSILKSEHRRKIAFTTRGPGQVPALREPLLKIGLGLFDEIASTFVRVCQKLP